MANFLRQKYKEKPQIWGSFESVQRSLFKNAERIGINPKDIALAMPMWERVGRPKNYSYNRKQINRVYGTPTFVNDKIRFQNSAFEFAINTPELYITGNLTIISKCTAFTLPNETKTIISMAGSGETLIDNYAGYIGIYPYQKLLCFWEYGTGSNVLTASSTITDITTNTNMTLAVSRKVASNSTLSYFFNSKKISTHTGLTNPEGTGTSAYLYIGTSRYYNGLIESFDGDIYFCLMFSSTLSDSQISLLSDNPYQLWQRQPDVYFSVPVVAGGTTYQATCEDILNISSSIAKQATFSASCIESVNLSGADGNNALFQAATLDNINFQELASNICNFTALISSRFSFSDSNSLGTTLQAILSDNINIADSNTAISTLTANISDSMTISEIISVLMSTSATSSDSISISESVNWGSVLSAIAESGISISDSNIATLLFYASIADSITIADNNSVNLTYNVSVSDVLSFSDTVSKIAMLRAIVAEQLNINDIVMEVSQLPNGKCSVTFTMKIPGAGITQTTGEIGFNIKTATITFNLI